MDKTINIYKPIGKTPLQIVERFKLLNPKYEKTKIGYAGRLDPMAHGVLLLLIYPETKNRNQYQNLDKIYEFEILIGISSDTHDLLGLIKDSDLKNTSSNIVRQIDNILKSLSGDFIQSYPPYSSKPVKGKPLFKWARENKLNEIDIPRKNVQIKSIKLNSLEMINVSHIQHEIIKRINLVRGDFRQEEIELVWQEFFKTNQNKKIPKAKLTVSCSSGTYVRAIADVIGEKLGVGALCYDILRTKVGDFDINDSIKLM